MNTTATQIRTFQYLDIPKHKLKCEHLRESYAS